MSAYLVTPKGTAITKAMLVDAHAGQFKQVSIKAMGTPLLLRFEAVTPVVLCGEFENAGVMEVLSRKNQVRKL